MRTAGSITGWTAATLLAGTLAMPFPIFAQQSGPAGKFYVVDVNGEAELHTGDRIVPLEEKSVYSAEGGAIETRQSSELAIVFSNGTSVHFAPGTRLEVRRFEQEPFSANRNDIESEPSVSHLEAYVVRGSVAIATAIPVAGSTMRYITPHVSVSIRGRRLLIETNDYETRVSLIDGDVTVRAGEQDAAGQTLRSEEQAIVFQPPQQPPQILVQPLPSEQRTTVDERVSAAAMARSTVYFDAAGAATGRPAAAQVAGAFFLEREADEPEQQIEAIPVAPITAPVDVVDENTVSASRIRS